MKKSISRQFSTIRMAFLSFLLCSSFGQNVMAQSSEIFDGQADSVIEEGTELATFAESFELLKSEMKKARSEQLHISEIFTDSQLDLLAKSDQLTVLEKAVGAQDTLSVNSIAFRMTMQERFNSFELPDVRTEVQAPGFSGNLCRSAGVNYRRCRNNLCIAACDIQSAECVRRAGNNSLEKIKCVPKRASCIMACTERWVN